MAAETLAFEVGKRYSFSYGGALTIGTVISDVHVELVDDGIYASGFVPKRKMVAYQDFDHLIFDDYTCPPEQGYAIDVNATSEQAEVEA